MKFTSRILVVLLIILIAGLLSSNIILKKEYDSLDKKDISEVIFEMSPDYQTTVITDPNRIGVSIASTQQINSNESMNINSVNANLQGYSLLDVGHAQIQSLQLHIADSSGIILSGGTLKNLSKAALINH